MSVIKRELSYDPDTGVRETWGYDPDTDTTYIETTQDVGDILDSNKAEANDSAVTSQGIKDGMWRYASIPLVIQLRWLNDYGSANWPLKPGNEKLLFKLLNSPEWRYLKTTGRIHSARG